MVRTQIQLTDEQMEALRALSAFEKKPLAELIRRSVQNFLDQASSRESIKRQNALRVIGKFSSKADDGGTNHDKYLADGFGT